MTPLCMRNVHRLFLTCLLIAHKFWDDRLPLNSHYAKCGGISLKEMNMLEKFFLKTVQFKLHVSDHTYVAYEAAVTAIERSGLLGRNEQIVDVVQKTDAEKSARMPVEQQVSGRDVHK